MNLFLCLTHISIGQYCQKHLVTVGSESLENVYYRVMAIEGGGGLKVSVIVQRVKVSVAIVVDLNLLPIQTTILQ